MSFESVMPPYNASDPGANFLSSSCLDFLLIELVPLASRITHERDSTALKASETNDGQDVAPHEDEEADAVHHRLETQGYRVGQGLVERYVVSRRIRLQDGREHADRPPRNSLANIQPCVGSQILTRPAPIQRNTRRDQVSLQGSVVISVRQEHRQPQDQSSGTFQHPNPRRFWFSRYI